MDRWVGFPCAKHYVLVVLVSDTIKNRQDLLMQVFEYCYDVRYWCCSDRNLMLFNQSKLFHMDLQRNPADLYSAIRCKYASSIQFCSVQLISKHDESLLFKIQGVFGSGLCYVGMSWCVEQKGPVFTSAFSPSLQIFVAIMDVAFFHEQIYLGRSVFHFVSQLQNITYIGSIGNMSFYTINAMKIYKHDFK